MKLLKMVGKTSDSDGRSVDSDGTHDNVHACAVLQTGVDNRDSLICHTVGERDDALYDILELFLRREMLGTAEQSAGTFNKNALKAVDHDFRDGVVIDESLKDIEPAD